MDPKHFVSELICLTLSGGIIVCAQVVGNLIAREEKWNKARKRRNNPRRRVIVIPASEINELRERGIQQRIIIPAGELHRHAK